MKHLPALIAAILLAGALSACVPAKQHEELKAEHHELTQALRTQERLLDDAKKDHDIVVAQLTNARKDLQSKRTELNTLRQKYTDTQQKYKIASDEVSNAARHSLALIEEKEELTADIIELQATIATLRDTVKNLRLRLAQAKPPEPQPADASP